MSDKMRRTFPMSITFGDGEQPTSQKLNRGFEQSRYGLNLVEKAIGDVWNQSGDATLHADYPLQIPNLARALGSQKYINPIYYPTGSSFEFKDHIGARFSGQTNGFLRFVPDGSVITGSGGAITTNVLSKNAILVSGDFYIDITSGQFWTYDKLNGTEVLTYSTQIGDNTLRDDDLLPCVIPDPRQVAFQGCRIRYDSGSGSYFLVLPPRQPLDFTGYGEAPSKYPNDAVGGELTDNKDGTLSSPFSLWQDPALVAVGHTHYRYQLPWVINTSNPLIGFGYIVPDNFLFLWDDATQTIIEGITFKTTTNTYELEIIPVNVADISGKVTTDDSEASFSSSQLSLLVASASVTSSLLKMTTRMFNHTHDGSVDFDTQIKHSSLSKTNPIPHTTLETGNSAWPISSFDNDDHPYLLSRMGSRSTNGRDSYNNAMLGDLILANRNVSTAASALDAGLPNESFGIHYGNLGGVFHKAISPKMLEFGDGPYNLISMSLDNTGSKLGINTGTPTHPLTINPSDQTIPNPTFFTSSAAIAISRANAPCITMTGSIDGTPGPWLNFVKTRGTPSAPTATISGDSLVRIKGVAYDGSVLKTGAEIEYLTVDAPGSNGTPCSILFKTSDGISSTKEHWRIEKTGSLLPNNTDELDIRDIGADTSDNSKRPNIFANMIKAKGVPSSPTLPAISATGENIGISTVSDDTSLSASVNFNKPNSQAIKAFGSEATANDTDGGTGIVCTGGKGVGTGIGGIGLKATGGVSDTYRGGIGLKAIGGDSDSTNNLSIGLAHGVQGLPGKADFTLSNSTTITLNDGYAGSFVLSASAPSVPDTDINFTTSNAATLYVGASAKIGVSGGKNIMIPPFVIESFDVSQASLTQPLLCPNGGFFIRASSNEVDLYFKNPTDSQIYRVSMTKI